MSDDPIHNDAAQAAADQAQAAPVREFTLTRGLDSGRVLRVRAQLKGGRYTLIDVLAAGGMGVIYRARDGRVGGNIVLIKAVKYDPGCFGHDRNAALYHVYAMRQRFKREKNVLLEMARRGLNCAPTLVDFFYDDNPELRQTFPFGRLASRETLEVGPHRLEVEVDQEPFLVMERIFGQSVQQVIERMSEARLLEVARAVCRILERLHAPRGRTDGQALAFIYMDLKPDNLLIDRQGGVTLVDFGAAIPVVGGVLGGKGAFTPGYAAPEIRRIAHPSAEVDHRVDLYSLGAILFQGLSRDHLDPALLAGELDDDFPVLELSALRSDIHPKTREVIVRALARDPRERFQDAAAMRGAIEDALREV